MVIGGVVAAAVVLAAAAAGVTAARRDARPAEVSFETPTGWREFPAVQFATQKGTPVSTRAVGIDPDNIAVLQTYRLPARVDTTSLGPIQREVDALVHQLAAETGASILSGPVPTTLGPLPGFRYQITTINGLGHHVESRLVFGFLDTTEYFLNCQHTAEQAHQVEAGCDIIVRSFWVR